MEGQQQSGTGDIKAQVQIGDRAPVHHTVPEGEVEQGVAHIEERQEEQGADHVEEKMDHGRPFGVFAGTDGGENGGDAGTDILPHDKRDGGVKANHTGGAHGLEDAHRGRGALDQGGDGGTRQNPQEGIGEGDEELLEFGQILKTGDRALHRVHADKEKAQPQDDLPHDAFAPAAQEQIQHNARRSQEGAQYGGLEQQKKQVVGGDIPQAQELCRDGGADIGPHDDADRLLQLHDARVNEADAHDGGGGGALDQSGDQRAQQDTPEHIAGQPFQYALQTAAGQLLQAVGHGGHAEEEGSDGPDEGDHVRYIHLSASKSDFSVKLR